jgi:hypothetical protein
MVTDVTITLQRKHFCRDICPVTVPTLVIDPVAKDYYLSIFYVTLLFLPLKPSLCLSVFEYTLYYGAHVPIVILLLVLNKMSLFFGGSLSGCYLGWHSQQSHKCLATVLDNCLPLAYLLAKQDVSCLQGAPYCTQVNHP